MQLDPTLRSIFEAVLGPDVRLESEHDGPETVPEWDSLNHLNLILAIESEFGIQFETSEIPELTTVGAIQARLRSS